MPESLSHLTMREINELTEMYNAGTKIADLKTLFNIDCGDNGLHRLLPPLIKITDVCPNCSGAMIKTRPPRNHATEKYSKKSKAWRCSRCSHIEFSDCICPYCYINPEYKNKSHMILEMNSDNEIKDISVTYPTKTEDFSFEQVISLIALAIYRWIGVKSIISIQNDFNNTKIPFAPYRDYGPQLINQLVNINIITKIKNPDIFIMNGMSLLDQPSTILFWNFPSNFRQEFIITLKAQIEAGIWPDNWKSEIYKIAYRIAMDECLEFYYWCAKQRKFAVPNDSSIKKMLSELLTDFSVAQCQYIVLESAKAASDYLVRSGRDSSDAAKYMLNNCATLGNDFKNDSGLVPNLDRNRELSQSMISRVLYEFFLPNYDGYNDHIRNIEKIFESSN